MADVVFHPKTAKSGLSSKAANKIKLMISETKRIDEIFNTALQKSMAENFVDHLKNEVFYRGGTMVDKVRCLYVSTGNIRPKSFFRNFRSLLALHRISKNCHYYGSRPPLSSVLDDIKDEYVGVFNVSLAMESGFFQNLIDILVEERKSKFKFAVLVLVSQNFKLSPESGSRMSFGVTSYRCNMYDPKQFVSALRSELVKIFDPEVVDEEINCYDRIHRSDRILRTRLRLCIAEQHEAIAIRPKFQSNFNWFAKPTGNVDPSMFALVYDIVEEAYYNGEPLRYTNLLVEFEKVLKGKTVKTFAPTEADEYTFRIVLDAMTYCGLIERNMNDLEIITFLPFPNFDLLAENYV